MRVAAWNMNHWQINDAQRTQAWELLKALDLDVSLVQEAVPAAELEAVHRTGGIGPTRQWGSAIVSFAGTLTEITSVRSPTGKAELDPCQTFPGSVVIAEHGDQQPTVFVSVYGLLDAGYAITTMHRILSDLTPLARLTHRTTVDPRRRSQRDHTAPRQGPRKTSQPV